MTWTININHQNYSNHGQAVFKQSSTSWLSVPRSRWTADSCPGAAHGLKRPGTGMAHSLPERLRPQRCRCRRAVGLPGRASLAAMTCDDMWWQPEGVWRNLMNFEDLVSQPVLAIRGDDTMMGISEYPFQRHYPKESNGFLIIGWWFIGTRIYVCMPWQVGSVDTE